MINSNGNFSFTVSKVEGSVIQQGGVITNTGNLFPEQNLADAAVEIKQLLDQLAQTYPDSDRPEVMIVDAVQTKIKDSPILKARLISALKAGGIEALKVVFNHPLVSVPVETIKGFLEAEAE